MTRPPRAEVTHRALLTSAAIVIVALLAVLGLDRCVTGGAPAPAGARASGVSTVSTPSSGLPTIAASALPAQARSVLRLIDAGGPFLYKQDDTVFSNFEGLLPKRASGYYHEYTVVTPGSPDRGTRRLVAGRDGDVYYTDDHYDSFRQVIR